MDRADWQRIYHIRLFCEDAEYLIDRFGKDYETFINDRAYVNSVAMCVLQIGKTANGLSEEFRKRTGDKIPWQTVRGMRNILVHSYGEVNKAVLWDTANNDIPKLKDFCDDVLRRERQEQDRGER